MKLQKEGFKIALTTILIALVMFIAVIVFSTTIADWLNSQMDVGDTVTLPANEKLVDYTIDKGKLYYSTRPMGKNYEPKEYKVYSNGVFVTTIVEIKK